MGLKPNHAMIFNPKDGSLQLTECDFLIVDGVSRDAVMSGLEQLGTGLYRVASRTGSMAIVVKCLIASYVLWVPSLS